MNSIAITALAALTTSISGCNRDLGCTHLVSLFPDAGLTEDVIHWGEIWTILETDEFHIGTKRLENKSYPYPRIVFFVRADTPQTIQINTIDLEISSQQLGSEKLSLTRLNIDPCSDDLCKDGELSAPLIFEASENHGMFFHFRVPDDFAKTTDVVNVELNVSGNENDQLKAWNINYSLRPVEFRYNCLVGTGHSPRLLGS